MTEPGRAAIALVLWCDDVDTTYAAVQSAGAVIAREPADTGNGNRTALVRDPDGTLLEPASKSR